MENQDDKKLELQNEIERLRSEIKNLAKSRLNIPWVWVFSLIFIIMKVTNVIDWSWWIVFIPIWLPFAVVIAIFLIVLVIYYLIIIGYLIYELFKNL